MTELHLRIADFKFTHNFVISDRLPDAEIIFGIDVQRSSQYHMLGTEKRNATYKEMANFNIYSKLRTGGHNWQCQSSLKILPRHNGVVPIKITGQAIKDHMAYFITDENSTKGRDPNINIINGIHSIKGKTSVNVFGV